MCFYGYWDWRFVPLLVGSVAINYVAARAFYATSKSWIVVAAIAADLAVLAAFKYVDFALKSFTSVLHLPPERLGWVLPLGISFFTFHHIMYLTDLRRGKAPMLDPVRYGLYIAFFPQILSGPLVRYTEIIHQFDAPYLRPGLSEKIGRGFMFLGIGLAEKLLFADSFARIAEPIFHASLAGPVPLMDAWRGALAFGLQIFFDFGGYSNMAIGVGLMFGVLLPQNFDRPYRATSLQDFWRRWHMTLSRFLRDYLYIPLGGSRHGLPRQMWALIVTMVLGGLWHGAGWTFIIWGALHGFGQAVAVLVAAHGREHPRCGRVADDHAVRHRRLGVLPRHVRAFGGEHAGGDGGRGRDRPRAASGGLGADRRGGPRLHPRARGVEAGRAVQAALVDGAGAGGRAGGPVGDAGPGGELCLHLLPVLSRPRARAGPPGAPSR